MKKDTAQTEKMIQASLERLFLVYESALENGLFDAKAGLDNWEEDIICPELFSKMLASIISDKSQDSLNTILEEIALEKRSDMEKRMAVLYFRTFSFLLRGEAFEDVIERIEHMLTTSLSDECRANIRHYLLNYQDRRQQKIRERFELAESPWDENDALQLPLVDINRIFETIDGEILSRWLADIKNIDLVIMFSGLSGKARMHILSGMSNDKAKMLIDDFFFQGDVKKTNIMVKTLLGYQKLLEAQRCA